MIIWLLSPTPVGVHIPHQVAIMSLSRRLRVGKPHWSPKDNPDSSSARARQLRSFITATTCGLKPTSEDPHSEKSMGLHFLHGKDKQCVWYKEFKQKTGVYSENKLSFIQKGTVDDFSHQVLRNQCSVPMGDVVLFCFIQHFTFKHRHRKWHQQYGHPSLEETGCVDRPKPAWVWQP